MEPFEVNELGRSQLCHCLILQRGHTRAVGYFPVGCHRWGARKQRVFNDKAGGHRQVVD